MMNELAKEIHEVAVAHGWWDNPPSFPEVIALCHSELSEALEEYRGERTMIWYTCQSGGAICDPDGCGDWNGTECEIDSRSQKPEGIAVEMADCIIRILDWCAHEGIDIDAIVRVKHEYNKTRPYRHGGKRI